MSAAVLIGVQVSEAHATVDLSGLWRTHFVINYPIGDAADVCLVTIVQTGPSLSLSGPCDGFMNPVLFSGTIDPDTGMFSATGSAGPILDVIFLSLQGSGTETAFSGTLLTQSPPFLIPGSFIGRRCGNGQIDAGETCDDGGIAFGDGCGGFCQVETCYTCSGEPSVCTPDVGAACDDGDACTSGESCDGSAVCTGGIDVCSLDHYKCYQGTDLRNPPFTELEAVSLGDQLSSSSYGELVQVIKLKFVCAPVDKNGEGITNSFAHLSCYQIRAADVAPLGIRYEVSTQFQTSRFALKKGKLLCLPSTKTMLP